MSGSPANESRLSEALATWEKWPIHASTAPTIIKYLGEGTTNNSVVVKISDDKHHGNTWNKKPHGASGLYRIRLNNMSSVHLGINRRIEHTIIKALEPYEITPSLIYQGDDFAFSVFEFIPGRIWTPRDFQDPSQVDRLCTVINSYQTLKLPLEKFDYLRYLHAYLEHIADIDLKKAEQLKKTIIPFFNKFKIFMNSGWAPTLSHHDLIPENVLEANNKLMLLDWEYAGLGHPELDLRYIQIQRHKKLDSHRDELSHGDIIDQLIYWLNRLWQELSSCAGNSCDV